MNGEETAKALKGLNAGDAIRSLQAGVARRDITTDARDAIIHDRLYAKALVLKRDAITLVMLSLDAVAIGGIGDIKDDFLAKLHERIERELGIPACQVMVHATHTHPPGRLLCDDDAQVERTFDAVKCALKNLTPVVIGVGRGCDDRMIINRTLRLKDGKHWAIRQTNPCPPDEEVASLGPIDPSIGVLRIDRIDGRPLAVVYNYACHPLVGVPGGHVTANYPGFASQVIEEQLGDGAMALFLQGAAGDITEVCYKDIGRPRDAQPIGQVLGLRVLQAWREIKAADATLNALQKTVEFPRRTDIPERLEGLQCEQEKLLASLRYTSLNIKTFLPLYLQYRLSPDCPLDYAYGYLHAEQIGSQALSAMDDENRTNLKKYLSNINAMEKLARIQDKIETLKRHQAINAASGEATVRAVIQGYKIGACVMLAAPVEVLAEVGLNVKRASSYPHTFVLGFTNGYLHYGPPAADYDKGGYEVTECLLGPQWQAIYERAAQDIIRRL